MLVSEFLHESAILYPNKVALICQGETVTYSQLEEYANTIAHALIEHGVQRQDRVAIYLENSIEAVVSLFGISKAGGIYLVVNPQVKRKKLAYILDDCQARVCITDATGVGELAAGCDMIHGLREVIITDYQLNRNDDTVCKTASLPESIRTASFSRIIHSYPPTAVGPRAIDIDLAALMYTSGSTGDPKGVMMTHLNVSTAASSIIEYLENIPEDVIINALPMSFDYGQYQILMSAKLGGTLVLERGFLYPYQFIDLIIKEKVSGLPLVPAMAALILQLKNLDQCDLSSVRYITNTGQALPPAHIKRLQGIFPAARIYSMYGLTECKRVSYLPPSELHRRPKSVGKAMPNTETWLIDQTGQRIAQSGVVGELVIRGGHVMKGYWNKPEATAAVLIPGLYPDEKVLLSGDYFKMDSEGFLYFVSRKDDLIKSGGERVSPKEIEDALYEHSEVAEAAVIGVPDQILGNAIKAYVALRDGKTVTPAELIQFCATKLERGRIPKYVEIKEFLPKSTSGKIKKSILAEEALNVEG